MVKPLQLLLEPKRRVKKDNISHNHNFNSYITSSGTWGKSRIENYIS
ncbi:MULTISPECIES: hypothetical protein [Crocosphaera]|uniref:Uncharacterized protein n=3 Tax=Crocosphaera watsonii TaxID=263511 RepID=T2JLW2_CROWT|nr:MULTISPECIES: hypothetical protein [Crocosphaera]EHJ11883.1 hypothetical protein CWATWH0003_3397 [Crocosphaera watsonii WH 0003]MCH2244969.1 hypothetical protein [Crocosphaera sp.]NQZ64272.1 hypothetical protein [Crocosphaera sp.]CCQ57710.1 hypothetical protein CWATWH0005_2003 [Crocosphaera watsonii WH 0005]CCQ66039.1 hypothetical protein CWATWH0402_3316 [Crocosphaera watsonii WH 0402]